MGCCGKQGKRESIKSIFISHAKVATDKVFHIKNNDKYKSRMLICESCNYRTWLSRKERVNWIICNLGEIIARPNKIAKNTSKLPVNLEPIKYGILCCQECRCVCDVKARNKVLFCCLDKWKK